jgi:hypothetical protein
MVLAISNRLRADGVDAHLDYYEDSPPEGWPQWMQTHIRNSTYVVVICTEVYRRRAMGEEVPARGLGVRWESGLITQSIYDSDSKNYKFIPAILRDSDKAAIPGFLRGATFYNLAEDDGYEGLLRHLTRQPAAPKPPLGKRRELPPIFPSAGSSPAFREPVLVQPGTREEYEATGQPQDPRVQRLDDKHMMFLTDLVRRIRDERGVSSEVPFFDPADGGVTARVLFLFESPGLGAIKSGFISRENPDGTARNFREMNEAAGLERSKTVSWNLVPWFIGSGGEKDRAIQMYRDQAAPYLVALFELLPRLQAVVLVGSNTWKEESFVRSLDPKVEIFTCPMPSPLWVNRDRQANRARILRILQNVRVFIEKRP